MTFAPRTKIGTPEPRIGAPLALSAGMHTALVALALLSTFFAARGNAWSAAGSGSAVTIGMVGSLPGIPLPRPVVVSTSRVADPTRGLYKSEPKPKIKEIPPDAKPLPQFEKEKKLAPTKPSKLLEDDSQPPPGAIPYGQGGTPSAPYSQFNLAGTPAGMGFSGPAGGDFARRYGWYVQGVQRRISMNWLQSTIDPAIRFAPRVVVQFLIFRDGTAANIQIVDSSGNLSVDRSALRAVKDSIPFARLRDDYSGPYVAVEFWFEFHR